MSKDTPIVNLELARQAKKNLERQIAQAIKTHSDAFHEITGLHVTDVKVTTDVNYQRDPVSLTSSVHYTLITNVEAKTDF